MQRSEIKELLEQKPGYEIVYKLLQEGAQREQKLAEYVGTDGGTLNRWLHDAVESGLIELDAETRICSQKRKKETYVEASLASPIPDDFIPVINDRGSFGPRDTGQSFIDAGRNKYWNDDHDL